MGPKMKAAATAIVALDEGAWATLKAGGQVEVEGEAITAEDVLVTHHPREGVVLEVEGALTVALDTTLTPSLKREGLARDMISRAQKERKALGLEITDRVELMIFTDDAELTQAFMTHEEEIQSELLANSLVLSDRPAAEVLEEAQIDSESAGDLELWSLEGRSCFVRVMRAQG